MLLPRGTWRGWKKGLARTSWSSTGKRKALHLGKNNPLHQYMLGLQMFVTQPLFYILVTSIIHLFDSRRIGFWLFWMFFSLAQNLPSNSKELRWILLQSQHCPDNLFQRQNIFSQLTQLYRNKSQSTAAQSSRALLPQAYKYIGSGIVTHRRPCYGNTSTYVRLTEHSDPSTN